MVKGEEERDWTTEDEVVVKGTEGEEKIARLLGREEKETETRENGRK